ncbi:MAG: glycosyltransferase family 1 protein [Chthoniobacterales bacterium]|nr:glycosyltransferase family 1 protein [Chthoniobacterales bacterium]
MKICDLTQFYSPVSGGVKRYISEKVAWMRRTRPDDRHVLVIPGDKTECREDGPARVYTIRSPLVSRTARYRALLNLTAVEEIIERERPDVIESGDPYQVAWKALASGDALGIPVVSFYHSHFPEAYLRTIQKFFGRIAVDITRDVARRYVRELYNRFAATIVPSPALARLLRDWGVQNTRLGELGVDTGLFRPDCADGERAQVRGALDIADDEILLLYVGRLSPEKNVTTLFEAFEELVSGDRGNRYALLVTGDGPERRHLARLKNNSAQVHWLPYQGDGRQLARLYRAADLFVHPGVQETFGLVALESQACGTPVVGIRGSYMDRIIFTDQHHWAKENSPRALAEAIRATATRDLAAEGSAAADRVRQFYSWDRCFARLFAVYREVAGA